ncbi:hypothetical protein [Hydromonas duriensis]|uniref:Uncharacterized protein n=1 Tax=Hydromonas duriensis TaxID=1527608 RepID=A0A4R6Y5A3_9BURK|nr:hypothetical protein [Hydromonas duriensis]TDR30304.1 hypothetical protein DFR44_12328 [Hydromonas duriensis]
MPNSTALDTQRIADAFSKEHFNNEDDIKIKFYSHIASPILSVVNPLLATTFSSEKNFIGGGRADAVFQNIAFEYKKFGYFDKRADSGIKEALYGRDNADSGLHEYLINQAVKAGRGLENYQSNETAKMCHSELIELTTSQQ